MKKILISSDCHGNFSALFQKVAQLHAKNNFDFMLMTGCVCPSFSSHEMAKLAQGTLTLPLPVYFIDSSDMAGALATVYPEGKEIANNFYYLGRMGVKNIQGINVAYFSGLSSKKEGSGYKGKWFSERECKEVISRIERQGIFPHILLTNQWPQEFAEHRQGSQGGTARIVSDICYNLSPRYHIAAGGGKHTRLPAFRSKQNWPTHFLNVAEIKTDTELPKDKYLVAIQINPSIQEECPSDIQSNPFQIEAEQADENEGWGEEAGKGYALMASSRNKSMVTAKEALDKNSYIYFQGFPTQTIDSEITEFLERWGEIKEIEIYKKAKSNQRTGIVKYQRVEDSKICLADSGKYSLYRSRIKFVAKNQSEKYRVSDCYLCFDKPNFDKSLLVRRNKLTYVCLDKGPISVHHFQIVPMNHVTSLRELSREEKEEIGQIKKIFQNQFARQGYTMVSYERYMNLSFEINHCMVHCVPIKKDYKEVMEAFWQVNVSNRFGFQEHNSNPFEAGKEKKKSDFYVEFSVWDPKGEEKRFSRELQRNDRNFQIGRQVVCEILDRPERLNWKDCLMGEKEMHSSIQHLSSMI